MNPSLMKNGIKIMQIFKKILKNKTFEVFSDDLNEMKKQGLVINSGERMFM